MSVITAIASRNALLTTVGKNAMNMKYPKEFELYVIAFELVDEMFNTLKYFIFPVNPSSMEEVIPQLTNVKKTLGGITVLKNPSFVPTDITLSGSFGRGFKVLLGESYEDFAHSFQQRIGTDSVTGQGQFATTKQSIGNGVGELFDERIKTGYGCIKILEEIVQESKRIGTDGLQRRLIFHNPALGNSYVVTAGTLRLHQDEQKNMVWNYNLPIKSVLPLESLYSAKKQESMAKQLNVTNYVQKRVNGLVHTLSKVVGDSIDRIPTIR